MMSGAMSDNDHAPSSVGHSTAWDQTSNWHAYDGSDTHGSDYKPYARPHLPHAPSRDSDSLATSPLAPSGSSSPPPRTSADSGGRPSTSRYRDSLQVAAERRDTASAGLSEAPPLVEPSFDENVLRALCDLDCGVPLLLDRIKQGSISCREASTFFKRRAAIEGEYGRDLLKLSRTSTEMYSMNDGKAGTFVDAWHGTMKIHEAMAENRIRFSQRLNEMSEELSTLSKEVEKNRKQTKDLATRYERALQESETATEKSKTRFDMSAEELERLLLQKEGEASGTGMQGKSPGGAGGKRVLGKAVTKGGLLLKGKNPGNIARQEDDLRMRISAASDVYRKSVTETQAMRQEYFNFQLPRILRALKECADEIDLGTQYHLTRYAFLFESVVLGDGSTLAPGEDAGLGLKATIESIDNRGDFRVYMQNYAYAHGGATRGPRREGPPESGFVPRLPTHAERLQLPPPPAIATSAAPSGSSYTARAPSPERGRPTFGVDLAEQMARDNVEVPVILEKCCAAVERYGLTLQGIYRVSGTMTKVSKLKDRLDRDLDAVDLDADEWASDINNVASVLKLWLRELPDPLLTRHLHSRFLDAARNDENRLRQIRLHEQVNDLPDANYATLRFLMSHLYKISQYADQNSMSISNIAIVFGPTLFGAGANVMDGNTNGGPVMTDAGMQNKAIETILEHYNDIFVDETESA